MRTSLLYSIKRMNRPVWDFSPTYQALANSIESIDRHGKEEDAIKFCGSLNMDSQKAFTSSILETTATILEIC